MKMLSGHTCFIIKAKESDVMKLTLSPLIPRVGDRAPFLFGIGVPQPAMWTSWDKGNVLNDQEESIFFGQLLY